MMPSIADFLGSADTMHDIDNGRAAGYGGTA